jgi:hypothetical protein
MGVTYTVACKDCKVARDLDKLFIETVASRDEAKAYSGSLLKKATLFREGLLLSFMADHYGHDCVLFSDSHDEFEHMDPDLSDGYKHDHDFWKQ